ncbi:MAG: CHAT domain-containing protein [Bacteroidales bacterium]|nr:CHAT domain-containing protein [Bacteroidales bacterium]
MKRIITIAMALMMGHASMAQSDCTPLIDQMYSIMGSGDFKKAIECGEKALQCVNKSMADKHNQDYFDVMNGLAQCYQQTKEFAKSQKCYTEMLEVMENAGDTTTNSYLTLLSQIPTTSSALKDYATSIRYYNKLMNSMAYKEGVDISGCNGEGWQGITKKAVRILAAADGWKTVSFDDNYTFPNLGNDLVQAKEYQLAIQLLSQTREKMRLKNLGSTDGYLSATINLAYSYSATSDFEKEVECYQEAYNLSKALLGSGHANTINLGNNLAMAKSHIQGSASASASGKKGDKNSAEYNMEQFWQKYNSAMYQEAYVYGQKALDILRKNKETHPELLMQFLNNVGNCLMKTGKPQKAVDYYNEVLDYLKENQMENSLNASVIMQNIAFIYQSLRDLDNEAHYRAKSMLIMAQIYNVEYQGNGNKTNADVVLEISNALCAKIGKMEYTDAEYLTSMIISNANMLHTMGRHSDYTSLLDMILQEMESNHGRNNKAGYKLLKEIALSYYNNDEYADALRFLDAAELTAIAVYGQDSYERTQIIEIIGNVYGRQNNMDKMLECYLKAEPIIKTCTGENSQEYISIISDIARAYNRLKDFENAAIYMNRWMSLTKGQIHDMFSFMTTQEKTSFYESEIEPLVNEFYILGQNYDKIEKTAPGIFYDYELLCKGLLLSSETAFNSYIRNCNNAEIQKFYAEYQENGQYLKEQARKPEKLRDAAYNDIKIRNSNIGHQLMTMSAEAADLSQNINMGWQDVRKSLGKNDVAIEFFKSSNNMYQAFVLTPKLKSPEAVPLFEERELKMAIAKATDKDCDFMYMPYESTAMYDMIWSRLDKYLFPGCHIYFAPKGILHTMAIEYAPMDGDSVFCQRYHVERISSTRDLVAKAKPTANKNALVYGGIEYQYGGDSQSESRGESINFLPGTLVEMNDVSACLIKNGVNTTTYQGTDATAQSLLDKSGGDVNILHIATHGIFRESGTNSLDNSGLAFSDKILSSAKISEMDLANTNLVVLSACETAKGNVTDEGVFGLQRAFKLSGAKGLIMSLWPVNDQSTRILMTDFYNNMFNLKMNNHDAFYKAVISMRDRKGSTPFNWAAFILLD